MTDLMTPGDHDRRSVSDTADPSGATVLLIHEALARSRMAEAEQAARRHRLARSVTAGRAWSRLARWADRCAERARSRLAVAAPRREGPRRV